MFQIFYPTVYSESAYSIDFQQLYNQGYRGLLTDVDNTLVEHGAPADDKARAFFDKLQTIGWKTCIISNNNEARVKPFADAVRSYYVCHAGKPGSAGYITGMEQMKTDRTNTLFLGDQMFTDILGANRTGLPSILVKPIRIDHKFFILLKRCGEAIVKFFYFRYAKNHPGKL